MSRYLRLLAAQLRASTQLALQYRVDFVIGGVMSLFRLVWTLLPVLVVWARRPEIAGWTLGEALLVVAWFRLLNGILEAAVHPALVAVIDHIRTGTLDFVLVKPADAQFLVSTARFEPWRVIDALSGVGIAVYAFLKLGVWPSAAQVGAALALTVASVAILYSLALLVVSAAFWVVRLDNLIYLFNAIFDAARWPSTVWRGAWRILFTFVIPLALMTTYPALALLGRLALTTGLAAIAGAALFAVIARAIWLRAIAHYTSASS